MTNPNRALLKIEYFTPKKTRTRPSDAALINPKISAKLMKNFLRFGGWQIFLQYRS